MNVRTARVLSTTGLLALNFLGCSGTQPPVRRVTVGDDIAPGTLLIDILEAGRPEHYWQYELQPATGTIRVVKETTFTDNLHREIPRIFQEPAGAIGACAGSPNLIAASPNGTFSAHCKATNYSDLLEIDSAGAGAVAEWKPKERGIRGFAWAPNSHSIAILNVSSYVGKKPLELLAAISGHPVPHDQILLDIFDPQTGQVSEYTIRNNVVSSFTRILNWSR